MFTYPMEVKSVITAAVARAGAAGARALRDLGPRVVGRGRIAQVEVSADGGQTWAEAALQEPVLPEGADAFRMAWRWNGGPAVLKSRATDETGAVQPTRDELVGDARHAMPSTTTTRIQAWSVAPSGEVKQCLRVAWSPSAPASLLAAWRISAARAAGEPRARAPGHAGRDRRLGHQHPARRQRPAAGQRHGRSRAADLRREVPVAATARRARASRTIGSSAARARSPAPARCGPSAATGPTRPPCSTMCGARCRISSRSR